MRSFAMPALLLAAALISACGASAPQISVNEPWVRAAVAMQEGTAMSETGGGHGTMGEGPTAGTMGGMNTSEGNDGHGEMAMGANSAAYLMLVNSGGTPDRLLSAATDAAAVVELHETTMQNNVMQMRPLPNGIEIPANGRVELKPGGLHIMLLNITRDLKDGERVKLTLTFEKAGQLEIEAPVRQP